MKSVLMSGTDWIWVAPMATLSVVMIFSLIDGLIFSSSSARSTQGGAIQGDRRINALVEVQRCCVVVGFLGTLLGTYKVLFTISGAGNQEMLQNMFQGMATAILSSVVGCIMFLLSAGAEQLVSARWAGRTSVISS